MRKITPVLESELPKLPDGWRWCTFIDETWMASCRNVNVYANELGVYVVYDYSPPPVPFEVIAAVPKANGVEL